MSAQELVVLLAAPSCVYIVQMYTSITEYDCFQLCWCVHFLRFYSVEQEIGSTRETWLDPKITAQFDNKLNVMFFSWLIR